MLECGCDDGGAANWRGLIKFGEIAGAVALYTAASSSERIAFNTLNRAECVAVYDRRLM